MHGPIILMAAALALSNPQENARNPGPMLDERTADVVLNVVIRGKRIRFDHVPKLTVEPPAAGHSRTIGELKYENIPDEPQPGVTYTDGVIRLTVISALDEVDKIVAEVLGTPDPPAPQPLAGKSRASSRPLHAAPKAKGPRIPHAPSGVARRR